MSGHRVLHRLLDCNHAGEGGHQSPAATLGSHERIGVFRIFGRDAGFSALYTAYVTSARCVIPEIRYDLDALAAVVAQDHHDNPSHYSFVITAEGRSGREPR